ncbi:MAG: hypothetical protein AB1478_06870 [Nitrospirota bacterium]
MPSLRIVGGKGITYTRVFGQNSLAPMVDACMRIMRSLRGKWKGGKSGKEMIVIKRGKPVVLMRTITDEAFSLKEKEKVKGGERRRGKRHL